MVAIGDTLGSYQILERIGEGGMGIVFRAQHKRLRREVAVKLLKPELAQRPETGRRFLEEARAVNDISHPKIVNIIDFVEDGQHKPPTVYMVMELLRGESLGNRIKRDGYIDPELVVAIGSQVADALSAVHNVGFVHRDLKADNIFLLSDGDSTEVKLLDFGSIKSMNTEEQLRLTDPGTAVGTPVYMAPEQVLDEPLDQRTDVYALGVVLYHALAGKLPFAANSYGALMVQLVKSTPPPIDEQRGNGPPVPIELHNVIMRCLEKDRTQRFQSMKELQQALATCLQQPIDNELTSEPNASEANRLFTDESADGDAFRSSLTKRWSLLALPLALVAVGALTWALFAGKREHTTPAKTPTTARDTPRPAGKRATPQQPLARVQGAAEAPAATPQSVAASSPKSDAHPPQAEAPRAEVSARKTDDSQAQRRHRPRHGAKPAPRLTPPPRVPKAKPNPVVPSKRKPHNDKTGIEATTVDPFAL